MADTHQRVRKNSQRPPGGSTATVQDKSFTCLQHPDFRPLFVAFFFLFFTRLNWGLHVDMYKNNSIIFDNIYTCSTEQGRDSVRVHKGDGLVQSGRAWGSDAHLRG